MRSEMFSDPKKVSRSIEANGSFILLFVVFNLITLVLFLGVNIFTTSFLKRSISEQIAMENRNHIISGDFRTLFTSLRLRIKSDFKNILVISDTGKMIHRFDSQDSHLSNTSDCNPLICAKISHNIYYDNDKKYIFGKITFFYQRLTSFSGLFGAWVLLFLSSIPLTIKLQNLFRKRMQRDFERQRHAAIVQTTQHIAHDLKNPIGIIDTSLNCHSWEEFQTLKPVMEAALLRLRSMVGAFKRADLDGLVNPDWTTIHWPHLVTEMQQLARNTGTKIHLEDQPTSKLYLDETKIERCIMNLIRNAIEAKAHNIWLCPIYKEKDLTIQVIDDGPGIAKELLPRLFSKGATNKANGSGLGLYFVQQIAEGHGGSAKYERLAQKSIFSLSLPFAIRPKEVISSTKDNNRSAEKNSGETISTIRSTEISNNQDNNLKLQSQAICHHPQDALDPTKTISILVNFEAPKATKALLSALKGKGLDAKIYHDYSQLHEKTILCTDDPEILDQGLHCKAEILFFNDTGNIHQVIKKTIRRLDLLRIKHEKEKNPHC